MIPLWHPLSAVFLTDPPVMATRTVARMLIASGACDLVYGGDRMWPAVRHGDRVRIEPLSAPPAPWDAVLACVEGCPDLARVRRSSETEVDLVADADPASAIRVPTGDILGRAALARRPSGPFRRAARRCWLDLREAATGRLDESEDGDRGDAASSVRVKYDAQAPWYVRIPDDDLDPALLRRIVRNAPAAGRVLVAGSGTGRECMALAGAGFSVTGVDFAPAMVEAARREAARRGVAAEFREADLRRVDEASGSLAAVHFTYDVYSFLPSREDRIALLRRMRGWLEPGGVILLSARRVRGGWARLVLLAQALSTRRGSPRTWGASHTRWLDPSGGLHRSFVQVFGERMIRREVDAAGLEAENWEGGHVLLRPVADLPAGRGRTSGE